MIRLLPVIGLLLVGLVFVAAGGEGDDYPPPETSRIQVVVVGQDVEAFGPDGPPLKMEELGKPAGALVPKAAGMKADGFVATVPHSKKILAAIRARGPAEVLWRGEFEAAYRAKGAWLSGTKIPFATVSLRGDQPTVSVTYEEIGAKVEAEQTRPDFYNAKIEFTAATRIHSELGPVVGKFSSIGQVHLPDGCTAIYSFLDRVPLEFAINLPGEIRGKQQIMMDRVRQYFVLLTRMDVVKE